MQERHNIQTDVRDSLGDIEVYKNTKGIVVQPNNDNITMEVVTICHQGDLVHRSADAAMNLFQQHYVIGEMTKTMEVVFVKGYYSKRLTFKTRTGSELEKRYLVPCGTSWCTLPDHLNGFYDIIG